MEACAQGARIEDSVKCWVLLLPWGSRTYESVVILKKDHRAQQTGLRLTHTYGTDALQIACPNNPDDHNIGIFLQLARFLSGGNFSFQRNFISTSFQPHIPLRPDRVNAAHLRTTATPVYENKQRTPGFVFIAPLACGV